MLACSPVLFAQSIGPSALTASGRSSVVNNITIEESIAGTFASATYQSPGLVVTPGVLQPGNSNGPNGIKDPGLFREPAVFPNPTEQIIFVRPAFSSRQALECTVTDNLGKVLIHRSFLLDKGTEQQSIDLTALAAGPYYLALTWSQSGYDYKRSFKIQKTR